jgi:aldose 1-epimerase
MEARIATYGGIVTSLIVADRTGKLDDVVLGYDDLASYLKSSPYFGALVGRYANRIAHATFALDGKVYHVAANDGPNSLHGGRTGFDKVVWTVDRAAVTPEGPLLVLSYLSQDGEEGYPGTLRVTAAYTLTEDNALRLQYSATTDRATIVNLTQHSYFNLLGIEHRGDVLGHIVQIQANRFTPVDATLIPTGELRPVVDTPFDFRAPTAIGARVSNPDEQLRFAKGYDHNWVIDLASPPGRGGGGEGSLSLDATVYDPTTGRVLEVLSDQPGLQFYAGNFLDASIVGKGGWRYEKRSGFCMEPQHFPDSPNRPEFPSTVLRPGQVYHSTIVYRFRTRP